MGGCVLQALAREMRQRQSHEWTWGISTNLLMPWLIPNTWLSRVHGVKSGKVMIGMGRCTAGNGWEEGYGPDFQARWGFRSWTKDGIEKHGRKHQQEDNVCKSMAWTSLEIRVKLSKVSSPRVTLHDACWCAVLWGIRSRFKVLDTRKPLPNLLFVWMGALLGD